MRSPAIPRPPDVTAHLPDAVVVVGLGAMGGSVAKACAARLPAARVHGIDPSPANAAMAADDGVEVVGGLGECRLAGAVVVYAAPLDATVSLVEDEAPVWSRAALATDVAGLKRPVLAAARRAGRGVFVGAHPMCGSEASGYGAARDDLFEGAKIWLCADDGGQAGGGRAERRGDDADAGEKPWTGGAERRGDDVGSGGEPWPGEAERGALARAKAFWSALGGRPCVVDAAWHDRAMSRASHLPQLVAWALAGVLADDDVRRRDLGSGGRGMTRLAASSPDMWLPLLEAAAADDAEALGRLERALAGVREALESGDEAALREAIRKARRWAAERS